MLVASIAPGLLLFRSQEILVDLPPRSAPMMTGHLAQVLTWSPTFDDDDP